MHEAAKSAGVSLKINSAFRTLTRQKYFYMCYQTKSCNGGNLAAYPGSSNHGIGRALDLSFSSYNWLASNARRFGFGRTVPTENWHWEKIY
jgi:LAS superfamily LD-carboxypeptidase LdcB